MRNCPGAPANISISCRKPRALKSAEFPPARSATKPSSVPAANWKNFFRKTVMNDAKSRASRVIGSYLTFAVVLATIAVMLTEALGALHQLKPGVVQIAWLLILLGAAVTAWRQRAKFRIELPNGLDAILALVIACIFGVIAWTAVLSPPNSADAMAYHLPRIIYWIQQRSVDFFPTPYLNQIMLQPFAEYLMLNTMLISGGDHFVNLVQWFGCVTSVIAVAGIAGEFGASSRGRILAALFCVTLPNGILQASGAKNDYVLAAWLAAAAYFLLRTPKDGRPAAALAGLALGLAAGTKATAYLYAPGLLLVVMLPAWKWWRSQLGTAALMAAFA